MELGLVKCGSCGVVGVLSSSGKCTRRGGARGAGVGGTNGLVEDGCGSDGDGPSIGWSCCEGAGKDGGAGGCWLSLLECMCWSSSLWSSMLVSGGCDGASCGARCDVDGGSGGKLGGIGPDPPWSCRGAGGREGG